MNCNYAWKRDATYDILKTYRLIDPNEEKEAVVKKINAFRNNYIREKKHFEESHHSGSGTDEICVPILWY
jgi:hypothetical protein